MPTFTPDSPAGPSGTITSHPSLLIVGCGYLGLRAATAANALGWTVYGTTRTGPEVRRTGPEARWPEAGRGRSGRCGNKWDRLSQHGIQPIQFDWNRPATFANLPTASHVLIAVAHDRHSGHDRFASQVGGLRRMILYLDRLHGDANVPLAELAYVSTTGVYHQSDGRWVDEASPTHPRRPGGQAHLRAEGQLRRIRGNEGWVILRLAGIYGPGRVPRLFQVRRGEPMAASGQGYLNLIHVDDAAAAVIAALQRREHRARRYCVADDQPVPRGAFYQAAAKIVGAPPVRFVSDDPQSRRSAGNKRVSNRRLKAQLLPRLQFPDYFAGLSAALAASSL